MNPAPQARPPTPLPVVVIGGYLGAGKTTLINHLLRHADGARVAVLVNDFGSINIDADLIAGTASSGDASTSSQVLALSGGCLCCSFGDDLVGTLTTLQQRCPPPDVVLIELSGVALPTSVVRTARLALGVDVVGTLVLADAEHIRRQATDRYVGSTVQQQLQGADWVLLNKTDLVTAAASADTQTWLRYKAPQARHLACAASDVPADWVLGWRLAASPAQRGPAAGAVRFAPRPLRPATRGHAQPFASASLRLPPGTRLRALGEVLVHPAAAVLRAKGLLADAAGQTWLLQVAGNRWAVTAAAPLLQPFTQTGLLVAIGLRGQMQPAALQAMIARCGADGGADGGAVSAAPFGKPAETAPAQPAQPALPEPAQRTPF